MQQGDGLRVHNDPALEMSWAEKAFKYAELLEKMIVKQPDERMAAFRFTPNDDKLYELFRTQFPEMNVDVIDVDALKSPSAKAEWYAFLETNKELVKDYNLGTLLRVNSQEQFGPQNSTITPRLQFYCLELARFREGHNLRFKQKFLGVIDPDKPQEPDEYTYNPDFLAERLDRGPE